MKIKVKYINQAVPKIQRIDKGNWIDLFSAEDYTGVAPNVNDNKVAFHSHLVPLGIAMQLPKGFEAYLLPRSSSFTNYGFILGNSQGIIDETYCGDKDEWKCSCIFLRKEKVKVGSKICQFRIQPSQFASVWTKIKWLFTSKIEFVEVESLGNENRDGFGSTGK